MVFYRSARERVGLKAAIMIDEHTLAFPARWINDRRWDNLRDQLQFGYTGGCAVPAGQPVSRYDLQHVLCRWRAGLHRPAAHNFLQMLKRRIELIPRG